MVFPVRELSTWFSEGRIGIITSGCIRPEAVLSVPLYSTISLLVFLHGNLFFMLVRNDVVARSVQRFEQAAGQHLVLDHGFGLLSTSFVLFLLLGNFILQFVDAPAF